MLRSAVYSHSCVGRVAIQVSTRANTRLNYSSHANPQEKQHFAALAESWWDADGPQRILHKMNLMRMDYIRDILLTYKAPGYSLDLLPPQFRDSYQSLPQNMKFLDVGCGGGLLSESLARADFCESVKGIDVTPEVLSAAKLHKDKDPSLTNITYELSAVEDLPASEMFDALTMFEVVEHLDDPASTLKAALSHVKPGGWAFFSTINRTVTAYLTTIFAAEHLFKIVPKGTHTYAKYINEPELRQCLESVPGVQFVNSEGCLYVPGVGWKRFPDSPFLGRNSGNYLMAVRKC